MKYIPQYNKLIYPPISSLCDIPVLIVIDRIKKMELRCLRDRFDHQFNLRSFIIDRSRATDKTCLDPRERRPTEIDLGRRSFWSYWFDQSRLTQVYCVINPWTAISKVIVLFQYNSRQCKHRWIHFTGLNHDTLFYKEVKIVQEMYLEYKTIDCDCNRWLLTFSKC